MQGWMMLDETYLSNTVIVAQMCPSFAGKTEANQSYTTLLLRRLQIVDSVARV